MLKNPERKNQNNSLRTARFPPHDFRTPILGRHVRSSVGAGSVVVSSCINSRSVGATSGADVG